MQRQEELAEQSDRLTSSIENMNRIQEEMLKHDPAVKKIEDVYRKIDQACKKFDLDDETKEDLEAFLEDHTESRDVFLACPMDRVGRLIVRLLKTRRD